MENSTNDRWLEIVGFPNYRMNPDTLEVKNISTDHILKKDKSKQITLRNNGLGFRVTLPRLLFSVMNGISLKEIPVNVFIVMENNKPTVYNMGDYIYKKKEEYRKRRMKDLDPLQTYREERDFIDKVIISLETGKIDSVFSEIYKHRNDIVSYLLTQGLVYNKDIAREIASCSLETTIEHILSGKVVFKPLEYIKNIARYLVMRARVDKRKQREFIDNVVI